MKTWLKLIIGISLLGAGIGVWLWLNRQRAQATTLQPATNMNDMLSLIAQIASTGSGTTMIVAAENKVDKEANKGLSTNDYTNDDQSKLASIASGATANLADATLLSRTNHTGSQDIATISGLQSALETLTNNKVDKITNKGLSTNDYTTAEKTKLNGITTGATANSTDIQLRDRSTHTGTQAITTISGLQPALDAKVDLAFTTTTAATSAAAAGAGNKLIFQVVGGELALYAYVSTASSPLQKVLTFN